MISVVGGPQRRLRRQWRAEAEAGVDDVLPTVCPN